MIRRSVMRHVRDQKWFAVGLDFPNDLGNSGDSILN